MVNDSNDFEKFNSKKNMFKSATGFLPQKVNYSLNFLISYITVYFNKAIKKKKAL